MGFQKLSLFALFSFTTLCSSMNWAQEAINLDAASKACGEALPKNGKLKDEQVAQFEACISEARRMSQEQAGIPEKPGTEPPYNCAGKIPVLKETCEAKYTGDLETWKAKKLAYETYINNHPNMYNDQSKSPSKILENLTAITQERIDRTENIRKLLTPADSILMATGAGLMAFGVTAPAGKVVLGIGVGFMIGAQIAQFRIGKLNEVKNTSCDALNKIILNPVNCDTIKVNSPATTLLKGDIAKAPQFSFMNSPLSEIDTLTGSCKKGASSTCQALVKNSPAGCFKKGGACMAGGTLPEVKIHPDGKMTTTFMGKTRTYSPSDFTSEASMIKAGFSPAVAKEIMDIAKKEEQNVLAKYGLDAKSDLKSLASSYSSSFKSSSNTASSSSGQIRADSYVPVVKENPSVVDDRSPASAMAAANTDSSEFNGEKIGGNKDNLFDMINRRYNLKRQQNIFIGE